MKSLRFLSNVVLVCNACFLVFMLLNSLGVYKPESNVPDAVERIPIFREIIIILGFSAVILNVLICLAYLVIIMIGKTAIIPKWVGIINAAILPIQIYFFFLS